MKIGVNNLCPCGSKIKYKKCCQPYHKGLIAKDVLTLMKSRYSAFASGDIKYIIKTSTFQKDENDLKQFTKECEFKHLKILNFSKDTVTFKATIFCDGIDKSFVEKSYFIQKNSRWYYDRGEFLDESI
jgi:SEC-C motif-containing protein